MYIFSFCASFNKQTWQHEGVKKHEILWTVYTHHRTLFWNSSDLPSIHLSSKKRQVDQSMLIKKFSLKINWKKKNQTNKKKNITSSTVIGSTMRLKNKQKHNSINCTENITVTQPSLYMYVFSLMPNASHHKLSNVLFCNYSIHSMGTCMFSWTL